MTQRQLHEFFRQTPTGNILRSDNNTPERTPLTPNMSTTSTPETSILPIAITKTINDLCIKYASMFCTSIKHTERVKSLEQHKIEGTIPSQMTFKFKKLFTQDHETNLRSTVINAAIDQEIAATQTKLMELNTKFDNRLQELEQTVTNPLNICNIRINSTQIVDYFNSTLDNKKLEFILKQNKDKVKKQAKREKFLARKEKDNEITTLSTRQFNKLQNEIKDLQKALKKTKLNPNSKSKVKSNIKSTNMNPKNVKGGQIRDRKSVV